MILQPVLVLFFSYKVSFIDVGPLVLMSFLFSSLFFSCWYFGTDYINKKRKFKHWLVENEEAIKQFKTLDTLLENFGKKIPCCKNCKSNKMQLWDYNQDSLLVVRCRSCKMNYTYSKHNNELLQLILFQTNEFVKLADTILTYRYHVHNELLDYEHPIHVSNIKSDVRPLEVLHFRTRALEDSKIKSIKDIILHEWEVVYPNRTEKLAS